MNLSDRARLRELRLFITVEHPCSYIPGRRARNLVADPQAIDNRLYAALAELGFRRSGNHIYRPHCPGCQACRSLRIPTSAFRPNRSQRRVWNRNQDLLVRTHEPCFDSEHYGLFESYVRTRHPNGGMDDATPDSYLSFIMSSWSDTVLNEFRLEQRLIAVAVTDRLENGLSAVYTFYDPGESERSLGTYAILWLIAEAQRQRLDWVYLGYWVPECRKMAYKANFHPHEIFKSDRWTRVTE